MSKPNHANGAFCWFECGSTDVAGAKKFYTELFGWKAAEVPMPGDMGGHYTLFKVGDEDMAFVGPAKSLWQRKSIHRARAQQVLS